MCLVTFWKCYFPPPPLQNPPPHNRKTTKTPPPTPPPQQQQNQRSKRESKKSKSQTNFITKISNKNKNESVTSSWVRGATRWCEWVHLCEWLRGVSGFVGASGFVVRVGSSGFVGVSGFAMRVGSSGFVGASGFAVRWSLYFLCLSLCAWSGNGKMISMIGDWVRRGWVWTIGAVRSSCSDVIFLLRRRRSSCFFSLSSIFQGRKSFGVKMKTEMIFHCFGSNFQSTGNVFQFNQIWSNNQTPNFPKNHFWN